MKRIERNVIRIGEQVVELSKYHGVTEVECTPFIKKQLKTLPLEERPSITAVLMAAKRQLWSLK